MALFKYSITISGGALKEGRVTAKSEAEARKRVAKDQKVVEWLSLKAVPVPQGTNAIPVPVKQSQPKASAKAKGLAKLERVLFLQHGRCFFCGQPLPLGEASIEHLNPRSRGGTSTEDNEVVCHKTLNQVFGDLELKRKFEYVLRNAGAFKCP